MTDIPKPSLVPAPETPKLPDVLKTLRNGTNDLLSLTRPAEDVAMQRFGGWFEHHDYIIAASTGYDYDSYMFTINPREGRPAVAYQVGHIVMGKSRLLRLEADYPYSVDTTTNPPEVLYTKLPFTWQSPSGRPDSHPEGIPVGPVLKMVADVEFLVTEIGAVRQEAATRIRQAAQQSLQIQR